MSVRLYVALFCVANNWTFTTDVKWPNGVAEVSGADWGKGFALGAIALAAVLAFLSLLMKEKPSLQSRPVQGSMLTRLGAKSWTPFLLLVLCFVKVRHTNTMLLLDGRIIETVKGYGTSEPWLLLIASVLLILAVDRVWTKRTGTA